MKSRPAKPHIESVKGGLKNTLLLAGTVGLCLLLAEVVFRQFIDDGQLYELEMWKYARDVKVRDLRPDVGHRHRPNREAQLMGVKVRTNALGFRGPQIGETATTGVVRIAFVGDSITLGWGVAEQETFAHQVIDMLVRQGRKVEGFNLGIGNYNTPQELALFLETGARLRPDIIVLSYFINDAEPMPDYPVQNWLNMNSAAWIVLSYRFDSLLRRFGELPDWKKYYRDLYQADAQGWKETQEAIKQFSSAARELGTALIVFNIPELRELKPYPFADVTDKIRAVVEGEDVTFVDLLPAVEALDPSSLWVTVPDPHPNGRANAAFGRQIAKEILPLVDRVCSKKVRVC
ncbi:MAG: SGNH/GDSL hydrolase family protein [bacterium]|nr:SGNH/GDSL hydrolase family protein [bacterium]